MKPTSTQQGEPLVSPLCYTKKSTVVEKISVIPFNEEGKRTDFKLKRTPG
jgi:hypothetical protein